MTRPSTETAEGWLEWTGTGKRPTGKFSVRLRNGDEWEPHKSEHGSLDWKHKKSDPSHDITAYKPIK